MTGVILVLNAGSSSIKFSVFTAPDTGGPSCLLVRGEVEGIGTRPHLVARDGAGQALTDRDLPAGAAGDRGHEVALYVLLEWLEGYAAGWNVVAAGHRVVHGGLLYSSPVRIDPAVIGRLKEFAPLAPLHQPHNIAAIEALARIKPGLPQVACFDTAFHRTQPAVAEAFALPRELS
jgi:acetate kinase